MNSGFEGRESVRHHRHRHRHDHQHLKQQSNQRRRQPQHHYTTTPHHGVAPSVVRQTPSSAQHYSGSAASVARQERFREVQKGYYPATEHYPAQSACGMNLGRSGEPNRFPIGLDYVNNDDGDDFRSPPPLVLDPNAPAAAPPPQSTSSSKQQGMMHNLLRGIGVSGSAPATTRHPSSSFSPSRNHHHQSAHSPPRKQQQQSLNHPPQPPAATELARRAPRAGFLQKLGTNIPTFKRRFFVLQPSTQLYYFLSPHDSIPRGAIPIDEARVERLEDLPDGRSRLALHWPDGQSMHLEARSSEVADEWCRSFRSERLSHVRAQLEESQQQYATSQGEVQDLKQQLEHFRFVEQDRDGALEDARRWKQRFEELDEAIRLLSNHVRKLPKEAEGEVNTGTKSGDNAKKEAETGAEATAEADGSEDVAPADKAEIIRPNDDGNDDASDEEAKTEVINEPTKADSAPNTDEPPAVENDAQGEIGDDATASNTDEPPAVANDAQGEIGDDATEPAEDNNNTSVSRRDVSLLDGDAATEVAAAKLFEQKHIIEELNAPGQHFPALINACQQLRENLRLASEEAATVVEDTKAAQDHAKTLQVRTTKAEKQLCQLWEENCSIRKTLKQKKREKRVLVREVKSLMEQQERHQLQLQQHRQVLEQQQVRRPGHIDDDASTMMGSDEERLINELEEHVVSSIRLHEKLVSGGSSVEGRLLTAKPASKARKLGDVGGVTSSGSTATTTSASTHSGLGHVNRQSTTSTNTTTVVQNASDKPKLLQRPLSHEQQLASLFDRSASESESEAEEDEIPKPYINGDSDNLVASSGPPSLATPLQTVSAIGFPTPMYDDIDGRSISSVAASFGGDSTFSAEQSRRSTPLRPNPLLNLSQEEEETAEDVDESKHFKPINIAQRGQATSRLVCPLADVVKTKSSAKTPQDHTPFDNKTHQEELQVYHLTFYTRKIGLQFQKVPAPPTKARGLLTDAMTADLAGEAHGSSKTAAELKRVAAISTWAKPSDDDGAHGGTGADTCLRVATPIDAVLVCGFEGFDDTGNNVRPKLGARLVAFDGVSVEVGKWTFDSIRKAIQARGRPLTLSFRNDFLTTDQREIMTKAVSHIERDPPQATPSAEYGNALHYEADAKHRQQQHHEGDRPPSVPSVNSAPSHETERFVNEKTFRTSNVINLHEKGHHPKRWEEEDDELTVSTTGYCSSDYHHPYHTRPQQQPRRTSGGSYSSVRRGGYTSHRSFSEAGSSASALSSAIGPLMSNLMSGLSSEKKRVNMAPEYLTRRASVESTPQHQDFQSNLL